MDCGLLLAEAGTNRGRSAGVTRQLTPFLAEQAALSNSAPPAKALLDCQRTFTSPGWNGIGPKNQTSGS